MAAEEAPQKDNVGTSGSGAVISLEERQEYKRRQDAELRSASLQTPTLPSKEQQAVKAWHYITSDAQRGGQGIDLNALGRREEAVKEVQDLQFAGVKELRDEFMKDRGVDLSALRTDLKTLENLKDRYVSAQKEQGLPTLSDVMPWQTVPELRALARKSAEALAAEYRSAA